MKQIHKYTNTQIRSQFQYGVYFLGFLLFIVSSCTKQDFTQETNDTESVLTKALPDAPSYYYFDEKIYLEQIMDKIFLQFAPNTDKERLRSLIAGDTSLQPTSDINLEEDCFNFAVLAAKDGRQIPVSTVESFKENVEVISVSYLYQYNGMGRQGLKDDFSVKLKESTSYSQLQKLSEQNNCEIEEDLFEKDQFIINLSKASKLDAMQMANLFYETELFEYAAPNFWLFDIASSFDYYFSDQWALKNTGQGGGAIGIDIKSDQAWTITTGNSNIKIAINYR